jgi:DNA-binding response OmpR family regulator
MAKIIVVEDNESIRESIKSYLELSGYEVFDFQRVEGVYEALTHKEIDLMVLDIMLPDGNGFVLAKRIRERFEVPIIFLTAKSSESDRITGFEVGGDDYMVKPFSVKELVLRVKTILKRTKKEERNLILLQFKLGHSVLKFDRKIHKLSIDEKEINLTQAEWEILHFLIINDNIVLDRSKILGESLDYMAEGSERTIDTHIKSIRKKMGNPGWIETVRGYGYKFVGEKI